MLALNTCVVTIAMSSATTLGTIVRDVERHVLKGRAWRPMDTWTRYNTQPEKKRATTSMCKRSVMTDKINRIRRSIWGSCPVTMANRLSLESLLMSFVGNPFRIRMPRMFWDINFPTTFRTKFSRPFAIPAAAVPITNVSVAWKMPTWGIPTSKPTEILSSRCVKEYTMRLPNANSFVASKLALSM